MSPKTDIKHMNFLTDMMLVLRTQQARKGWLVVLCPTERITLICAQLLSVLIPEGTKFSGRTAALPTGNLSVACVKDPVFPVNESFAVSFIGWVSEDNSAEVSRWRMAALEVISLKTL